MNRFYVRSVNGWNYGLTTEQHVLVPVVIDRETGRMLARGPLAREVARRLNAMSPAELATRIAERQVSP